MIVNNLLSKLNKVKSTGRGRWVACCPAHDDKHPSLSISESDTGSVLLHCFGGCSVDSIVSAVGLELSELFPKSTDYRRGAGKLAIPYADILKCLRMDAQIIELAAIDILNGNTISEVDFKRLRLARSRIEAAVKCAKL